MNEGLVDKLYLLKYEVDEESHLVIKDQKVCSECEHKPCINRCPAEVYSWEGDRLQVAYENCVECGVCKIVCPYENIDWRYPRGGYGVSFKFG
ncbi:MAG: 4Fe-4S dicluster domain-containing protein [Armatimonadetes bacterium]|nr:4Fe-4S dicluster domain-containing protein [Armatimonadota bacterium]